MKKIIKLSLIVITLLIVTGCESKDLTTYVKEQNYSEKEKIGYIKMDVEKFKRLATQKEFKKLMDYVKEKKYKYFMVDFENKKGLYCLSPNCLYEKIDKTDKGVYISGSEFYGKIETDENDEDYVYTKYEEN